MNSAHKCFSWWAMVCVLLACRSLAAQGPPAADTAPLGKWFGTLETQGVKLRLEFEFQRDAAGGLKGKLVSLDQGNTAVPFDAVTWDNDQLTATAKAIQGEFVGTLSSDRLRLSGTFTQLGMKMPLRLKFGAAEEEPEAKEVWQATLRTGVQQLKLQLRLMASSDGGEEWLFDSLTQGVRGITARQTSEGDQWSMDIPAIKAEFRGTLADDRQTADGQWQQGGLTLPLRWKKVPHAEIKVPPPKRPQNPQPPLPYRESSIRFENQPAGIALAGTLTLPLAAGNYPAVVLVSGSGPQDRDESILGHKPFLVIADHLTRRGIAVLRYDDRGVGASQGDFSAATTLDFAQDAAAAVAFLKDHEEIDSARIGVVGHSEGGLVAPWVAAHHPLDVAHIVLLAGPGIDGGEIILSQTAAIRRALGEGPAEVDQAVAQLSKVVQAIRAQASDEEVLALVDAPAADGETSSIARRDGDAAAPEPASATPDQPLHDADTTAALLRLQVQQMTGPWFRFFVTHDPLATLSQVRCPVLALNGARDLQVLPELNLPRIEETLRQHGHGDSQCVSLPGLNHLFQTCDTGSPTEYATIEETIAPRLLDLLAEWILAH